LSYNDDVSSEETVVTVGPNVSVNAE